MYLEIDKVVVLVSDCCSGGLWKYGAGERWGCCFGGLWEYSPGRRWEYSVGGRWDCLVRYLKNGSCHFI